MKFLILLFALVLVAEVSHGAEAEVIGNGREKGEADFSQGFHVVEVKKEVKETFLFPISGNPSSLLSAIIGTPGFDLVRSPAITAPLLRNSNFDSSVPTTTPPPATASHSSVIPTTASTTPPSTATSSHYYPTTGSYSNSFNTGYTPTTARSPRPTGSYSSATVGVPNFFNFVSSKAPTTPPPTATASHHYPTTGSYSNSFNTGYTPTTARSPRPTGSYSSATVGVPNFFNFVSSIAPTTPPPTATASHYYPTTGSHPNSFNTGYTATNARSPKPTGSYSSATVGVPNFFNFVSSIAPTTPPPTATASHYYPTTSSHSNSFNTGYTPTTARAFRPTGSHSSPTDGGWNSLKFVSTGPTTPGTTVPVPTTSSPVPTTPGSVSTTPYPAPTTSYPVSSTPSPTPIPSTSNSEVDYLLNSLNFGDS